MNLLYPNSGVSNIGKDVLRDLRSLNESVQREQQNAILQKQTLQTNQETPAASESTGVFPFLMRRGAALTSGILGGYGSFINLIPDIIVNRKRNRLIQKLKSYGYTEQDKVFKDELEEFEKKINPFFKVLGKIPRTEDVRRGIDKLTGGLTQARDDEQGLDRIFEIAGSFVAPFPGLAAIKAPAKALKSIPQIPAKAWEAATKGVEGLKNSWKILPPKSIKSLRENPNIMSMGEKLTKGLAVGATQVGAETLFKEAENPLIRVGAPLALSTLMMINLPKKIGKKAISETYDLFKTNLSENKGSADAINPIEWNRSAKKFTKDFARTNEGKILSSTYTNPQKELINEVEKRANLRTEIIKGRNKLYENIDMNTKKLEAIDEKYNGIRLEEMNKRFNTSERNLENINKKISFLESEKGELDIKLRNESQISVKDLNKKKGLGEQLDRAKQEKKSIKSNYDNLKPFAKEFKKMESEKNPIRKEIASDKELLNKGKLSLKELEETMFTQKEVYNLRKNALDKSKNLYEGTPTDISKKDKEVAKTYMGKFINSLDTVLEKSLEKSYAMKDGKLINMKELFLDANMAKYALERVPPLMKKTMQYLNKMEKLGTIFLVANIKKLMPYVSSFAFLGGGLGVWNAVQNIRKISSSPILREAWVNFLKATWKNNFSAALTMGQILSREVEREEEKRGRFQPMGKVPDKIMKNYVKM